MKPKYVRLAKKNTTALTKPEKRQVSKIVSKKITSAAEKRYTDTSASGQAITYSGTVFHLTATSQGNDDLADRQGDRITLTSCKGYIHCLAGDAQNTMRAVVVQCLFDASLAAPIPGEILQYVSSISAPISPYTKDYVGSKIRILYDSGPFNLESSSDTNQRIKKVNIFGKKLKSKLISYNNNGTIPIKNALYLMLISDSSAVSHPTAKFILRTRYIDL